MTFPYVSEVTPLTMILRTGRASPEGLLDIMYIIGAQPGLEFEASPYILSLSFARLDGGLPSDLADSANDMTKADIQDDIAGASGAAPFQPISAACLLSAASVSEPSADFC